MKFKAMGHCYIVTNFSSSNITDLGRVATIATSLLEYVIGLDQTLELIIKHFYFVKYNTVYNLRTK